MNIPKGGRGHKVPYESKVKKIPEPILDEVEKLIDRFYSQEPIPESLDRDKLIQLAQNVLLENKTRKLSTKGCFERFLQSICSDKSIRLQ